jgi:hypothetical protein
MLAAVLCQRCSGRASATIAPIAATSDTIPVAVVCRNAFEGDSLLPQTQPMEQTESTSLNTWPHSTSKGYSLSTSMAVSK